MINIKRPKSKTEVLITSASEHLFEIAAGLFIVMIISLIGYLVIRVGNKNTSASVAGIQTTRGEQSKTDLLNTIAEGSNYKYFFDALTKTGLYQMLKDTTAEYTVFVPEDSAFTAMGDGELNKLFADNNRLTQLVKNHIVSGRLNRLDFDKVEFMRSINGKFITINKSNYGTLFNSSKLMSSGTEATNGITYELDSLIL